MGISSIGRRAGLHLPSTVCFMLGSGFEIAIGLCLPLMEDREEFLTARQLAKILQVSQSTVRRLARKRRIPSVRVTPHIIRFHLDAVREAPFANPARRI